jgi:hypothetical protein
MGRGIRRMRNCERQRPQTMDRRHAFMMEKFYGTLAAETQGFVTLHKTRLRSAVHGLRSLSFLASFFFFPSTWQKESGIA